MVKYTTVTLNAIALTSLLSTSINAYKPASNEELKTTVNDWCLDPLDTEVRVGAIINDWDVSDITSLDSLFENQKYCEPHISKWDVSSVTSMSKTFKGATAFNSPLNDWDVSNVGTMDYMFAKATKFNQHLGSWRPKRVANMEYMFWLAESFNQPLLNWDVSNVARMDNMFLVARKFDQRLDKWDMSNVLNSNNDCSSLVVEMFVKAGPTYYGPDSCNVNHLQTWNLWEAEYGPTGCSYFDIFDRDCTKSGDDEYGALPSDAKTKKQGNKEWKKEWKNKQKNKMKVKNAKKNKSN